MERLFCNACERGPLEDDDVVKVELRSASLPGTRSSTKLGLATDEVTAGVLCRESCAPALHAMVGDEKPTPMMGESLEKLAMNLRADSVTDAEFDAGADVEFDDGLQPITTR